MGARNKDCSQVAKPVMRGASGEWHPPLIVFHSLADALAALAAAEKSGRRIVLITAPGAAGYAGVGWFLEVVAHIEHHRQQARIECVLDCGTEPGLALAAIRSGVKMLRVVCENRFQENIAGIAADHDVDLFEPSGPVLDLQFSDDAETACCDWIDQHSSHMTGKESHYKGHRHRDHADKDHTDRDDREPRQKVSERPQLYLITPPRVTEPVAFADILATVLRDSADAIAFLQLRIKTETPDHAPALAEDAIYAAVTALKPVCSDYQLPLILNDDPRLAAELECDGVHIGAEDASCRHSRAVLGPEKIIGVSCYDALSRARQAAADGADYVAFGAFFPSRFKPMPRAKPSPAILREWNQQHSVPAAVIGGITPEHAGSLIHAGAQYLCAIGAVWDHPDGPATAVREFIRSIDQAMQE